MSKQTYTIPSNAKLLKTGLYYSEKITKSGILREIYAEYGWVIYEKEEMELHTEDPENNPISYSYMIGLLPTTDINLYDVCEITEDIKIYENTNDVD